MISTIWIEHFDIQPRHKYAVEFTLKVPGKGWNQPLPGTFPAASATSSSSAAPERDPDANCYQVDITRSQRDLVARLKPVGASDVALRCPAGDSQNVNRRVEERGESWSPL